MRSHVSIAAEASVLTAIGMLPRSTATPVNSLMLPQTPPVLTVEKVSLFPPALNSNARRKDGIYLSGAKTAASYFVISRSRLLEIRTGLATPSLRHITASGN
jgi:hypothetical protein